MAWEGTRASRPLAIATAVDKYAPHTVRVGLETELMSIWHSLRGARHCFLPPSWGGRAADPEEKRGGWESIDGWERRN